MKRPSERDETPVKVHIDLSLRTFTIEVELPRWQVDMLDEALDKHEVVSADEVDIDWTDAMNQLDFDIEDFTLASEDADPRPATPDREDS